MAVFQEVPCSSFLHYFKYNAYNSHYQTTNITLPHSPHPPSPKTTQDIINTVIITMPRPSVLEFKTNMNILRVPQITSSHLCGQEGQECGEFGGSWRAHVSFEQKWSEIKIQQEIKQAETMIFPQDQEAATVAYYPYFFLANVDYNSYNYFSPSLPAFLLPQNTNMVYEPQSFLPSEVLNKTAPTCDVLSPLLCQLIKNNGSINSPPEEIVKLCNRNVLPNNVSLILCFIRRVKKSGKMLERMLRRLDPRGIFSSKRFYAYQLYLKDNCTDFKWKEGIEVLVNRVDPTCCSFSPEEQAFYNKLCRMLIVQYLQQICRLEVLNHTKINPTHISDHLRVIRYIRHSLRPQPRAKLTIQYT